MKDAIGYGPPACAGAAYGGFKMYYLHPRPTRVRGGGKKAQFLRAMAGLR